LYGEKLHSYGVTVKPLAPVSVAYAHKVYIKEIAKFMYVTLIYVHTFLKKLFSTLSRARVAVWPALTTRHGALLR